MKMTPTLNQTAENAVEDEEEGPASRKKKAGGAEGGNETEMEFEGDKVDPKLYAELTVSPPRDQ